jgi:hypothetical protein
MNLDRVQIKNFRSIEDVEIAFDPKCLVLVGINESGKSNVLKAMSSLGDYMPSSKDDVREPLQSEPRVQESQVRFLFSLTENETKNLLDLVSMTVLARNLEKTPIVKVATKDILLKKFVERRNTGLYKVDVLNQKKTPSYWNIGSDYTLLPDWKKPSEACPQDCTVDLKSRGTVTLKSMKIVHRPDFPDIPDTYFAPASIKDLATIVGLGVMEAIAANLPETLLWEYSDQNLLPGSIDIDEFAANPDSCLPLKNMFVLAGIQDISKAITDARSKSRNTYRNFFRAIADKATSHFRSVWKEQKTVEFELEPEGDRLIPGIREKNTYDFAKRSDGFKRFVSFLLLISANVKSGALADTLLLIDEPDASLHPSGARFLRDELIRISKTNYVVYSTHSIFMIDGHEIGRHIIVKKKTEKTEALVADESNFFDEEVIYNALGYSVFDTLKKKNIIFEGWKDKRLFQVAIGKLPEAYSSLKDTFADIGQCHARGVKHIKSITPFMEMAQRECIIISDGDAPAKGKQKEYADIRGYGTWRRYDEVLTSVPIVTGEDFLKVEAFRVPVKEVKGRHSNLADLDESQMSMPQGKLYALNEWLRAGGVDKETRESELKTIKNQLFEKLKVSDVDDSYFQFLAELAKAV